MASKAFLDSKVDLGFLTDTRLDGFHTSFSETYTIISTK